MFGFSSFINIIQLILSLNMQFHACFNLIPVKLLIECTWIASTFCYHVQIKNVLNYTKIDLNLWNLIRTVLFSHFHLSLGVNQKRADVVLCLFGLFFRSWTNHSYLYIRWKTKPMNFGAVHITTIYRMAIVSIFN